MKSLISREQDYALRITTFLAGLQEGEVLSLKEITNKLFISRNFVGRIISKLKEAGIVDTKQGKTGGIFLAKPATDISIFDVVSAAGFKVRFNLCLGEDFSCELISFCKFHSLFNEQEQLFYNNLKKLNIKDFLFNY